MKEPPTEKSWLSDEQLEALNHQVLQQEESQDVDAELARAREALKMIHQVRDFGEQDTKKVKETEGATPAYSELDGELDISLPQRIGRFEIERVIGKGGFGMVLLAHDPNLGRDVALKIPRPEVVTTPDLKSRFLREGRAAAALAHPNIVPVYESGQIGSICYLASQYVDGQTLAQWISNHRPISGPDAARVCQAISEALAHAHQRGLLHRDIKPTNVMVKTPRDGEGLLDRIQITDFGLAKDLAEDSEHTQTGALIGTPAYMSPEQASQNTATQASDIYSAGAVLYEMLTGKPPFVGENIVGTIQEVIHSLPRSPRKLNPKIPADLEAICLKCLEKQPARRYASAMELRSDLERFLNREPVKARHVTSFTRVAKWLSRNRLATCLLVVLAAGIIGTTVGLFRAQHAELEARNAEANAIIEANTAVRVSEFLVELFEVADATRSGGKRGKEVTAKEILDQGAKAIRRSLAEEPEIQARLLASIGRVYNNLGLYDQAEVNLTDALALQANVLDENDVDLARTRTLLGNLYRRLNRYDEAVDQINQAIAILDQDVATHHEDLARAYNELGLLLKGSDPVAAHHAYQQARDLTVSFKGADHASLWQLDFNLAAMDYRAGRYEEAKGAFERALEGATRLLGEDNPRVGTIMNNLAFAHQRLGNYRAALALRLKDLELIKRRLGENHPQVIEALFGLSSTCKRLGDYDSAKQHGAHTVAIVHESLPASHRHVWTAHNNYADSLLRSGDFEDARDQLVNAISCLELRDDEQVEFNRLTSLNQLSRAERLAGNGEVALEVINEAAVHTRLDEKQTLAFETRMNRAQILAVLDHDEAEMALHDAIAGAEGSGVKPQTLAHEQARFWALSGDSELALEQLDAAFESGYRDLYALTDPDFSTLREQPKFLEFAARLDAAANGD